MTIAAEIQPRLVYITVGSAQEAEKIASDLLENHLIACANIIPTAHTLYRWKEKIESAQEAILIVKTVEARMEAVMHHIKTLHSYECPAISTLVIEDGDTPFLSWLAESTAKIE